MSLSHCVVRVERGVELIVRLAQPAVVRADRPVRDGGRGRGSRGRLDARYRAIPIFAVRTSLRPEEQIALERAAVDREAGVVHVRADSTPAS